MKPTETISILIPDEYKSENAIMYKVPVKAVVSFQYLTPDDAEIIFVTFTARDLTHCHTSHLLVLFIKEYIRQYLIDNSSSPKSVYQYAS